MALSPSTRELISPSSSTGSIFIGSGARISAYPLIETVFLPEDFSIINYYMTTTTWSQFVSHMVCLQMLPAVEGERFIGDLTLFDNTLNRRLAATSEAPQPFASKDERVDVL